MAGKLSYEQETLVKMQVVMLCAPLMQGATADALALLKPYGMGEDELREAYAFARRKQGKEREKIPLLDGPKAARDMGMFFRQNGATTLNDETATRLLHYALHRHVVSEFFTLSLSYLNTPEFDRIVLEKPLMHLRQLVKETLTRSNPAIGAHAAEEAVKEFTQKLTLAIEQHIGASHGK